MSDVALYTDQFESLRDALPGSRASEISKLRKRAMTVFEKAGFPHGKIEEWRYTNLRPLVKAGLEPFADTEAKSGDVPENLAIPGCYLAVFINGVFDPALSDLPGQDGVEVLQLSSALGQADWVTSALERQFEETSERRDTALVTLNAALMRDGVALRLADNVKLDKPLQLLHLASSSAAGKAPQIRHVIIAGEGSEADIIETWSAAGDIEYWNNAVAVIDVAAAARLHHYKIQDENARAFHTALSDVSVAPTGYYENLSLMVGGRLARNEIVVDLNGEDAQAILKGASLGVNEQMLDTTTRMDHVKGGAHSDQTFKSVLDDKAHGFYQGRVTVRPDAQKTDAHQANHNLLLARSAEADSKPELEIFADDVQCSHGATVGELNEEAMYYMKARGITEDQARAMLIRGFITELFDREELGDIGAAFVARIERWLDHLPDKVEAAA